MKTDEFKGEIKTLAFDEMEPGVFLAKVKVNWEDFRDQLMRSDVSKDVIRHISAELAKLFIEREGESLLEDIKKRRKKILNKCVDELTWRI